MVVELFIEAHWSSNSSMKLVLSEIRENLIDITTFTIYRQVSTMFVCCCEVWKLWRNMTYFGDVLRPSVVAKSHLSMRNSERTGGTHRKIGYNSFLVERSSQGGGQRCRLRCNNIYRGGNQSKKIDINTFTRSRYWYAWQYVRQTFCLQNIRRWVDSQLDPPTQRVHSRHVNQPPQFKRGTIISLSNTFYWQQVHLDRLLWTKYRKYDDTSRTFGRFSRMIV